MKMPKWLIQKSINYRRKWPAWSSSSRIFPNAECVDLDSFNIADENAYTSRHWKDYNLIINAAAYTNVDGAETPEGRVVSWQANAHAVKLLAKTALENNITLVHVSSDLYSMAPRCLIKKTSHLARLVYMANLKLPAMLQQAGLQSTILCEPAAVGKGKNFVKTMKELAEKGVEPAVVNDQLGSFIFTDTLASAIHHLVSKEAKYGTYNITNDGEVV